MAVGLILFWEQGDPERILILRMIRQRIFSTHTNRDADVHLKFAQRMKFGVFVWSRKKTRVRSGQYEATQVEDSGSEEVVINSL